MSAEELSELQQHILDYIREHLEANGYPPTVREIGNAVKIKSTSHIAYHLNRLEDKGFINRDNSVSRGIRLTEEMTQFLGAELVSIPFKGYIVASEPIPVEALPGEETVELSRALFGRDVADLYALSVQGDSMIDALINDGDLVIIRHQEKIENGEMAAVWIKDRGETTLKKVYYEGSRVRLQPANPMMEAFYEPADNVLIQGKVVMVVRQLE